MCSASIAEMHVVRCFDISCARMMMMASGHTRFNTHHIMSSGNGTGTDAEAGPSGTASTDKHSAPTLRRYEAVLKDEEAYQAAQYASPDDLPGCMRLL